MQGEGTLAICEVKAYEGVNLAYGHGGNGN